MAGADWRTERQPSSDSVDLIRPDDEYEDNEDNEEPVGNKSNNVPPEDDMDMMTAGAGATAASAAEDAHAPPTERIEKMEIEHGSDDEKPVKEEQSSPNPNDIAATATTATGNIQDAPRLNEAQAPIQQTPVDEEKQDNAASPATTKPPAPKRKRGTATAVKGPKRARQPGGKKGAAAKLAGGSTGGAGGGAKRKTSTRPGTAASEDGTGNGTGPDGNDGGTSESDSGPYCLCRGPDNHRFMIACDRCEDWFHGECIGMDKYTGENLVQKYICPNCSDGKRYVTRYKKMCSLKGCNRPARVSDHENASIFCSAEHCQSWWENLIATLPRTKEVGFDHMTQGEFMGLLDAQDRAWKAVDTPFGVSEDFWDKVDHTEVLTAEELSILEQSATDRQELAEKIELCAKMLQLVEMAIRRREAAVGAGKGSNKDLCGYDTRLGDVGTCHQFGVFLKSPAGEAIFSAGRLDASITATGDSAAADGEISDPVTAGMCVKKKCKPHAGWISILTKTVKHDMKEFSSEATEKLNRECHVRHSAASRFLRKKHENNTVEHIYYSDDEDVKRKKGPRAQLTSS